MHIRLFYFCIVSLSVKSSLSIGNSELQKCCPAGQQLSGDGRSCVDDEMDNLEYNSEDAEGDNIVVNVNDTAVTYRLRYRRRFECGRPELYFIKDDIAVVDDDVVVSDEGGDWTLSWSEVCVDSVKVPEGLGLPAGKVYVGLLCPACGALPCVHKCCPQDYRLQVSQHDSKVDCEPLPGDDQHPWASQVFADVPDRTFLMHGFPECTHQPYLFYPDGPVRVTAPGHLVLPMATVPRAEYCADLTPRGPVLVACRQQLLTTARHGLYSGLFVVGAVFLAVTLVLHLWLPELRRTLHSRIVTAHVACLLVGYVALAVTFLAPLHSYFTLCSITAFTIQFSILAAIFWLNVMCLDIAWTFSGLRAPKASLTLDSDGHKFLYYSLYAWGSTAAVSGATAFLEYSPLIPPGRFKPSFGLTACWFQHRESVFLLFYGPMGLLLLSNIGLFVYTFYKIQSSQRDTANMLQHAGTKLRENKDRFSLYLKLFCLMGVSWIFEFISWLVGGPDSYWIVTDIINALRGVLIFVLFCLKDKVLVIIKAKIFPKKTSKFPIHPRKSTASSKLSSSMSSQRTNSIHLTQVP